MIEQIVKGNRLLSIIIRATYKSEGIKFFTPDDFSQQLAYMNRSKNYVIPPHVHNEVRKNVHLTQEVLIIKSGKVRVDYYDENKNYFESVILNEGDIVLLAYGGHGFEMLEDSEIIEVKQGPFTEDLDKIRFNPIEKNKLKVRLR